MDSVTVRNVPPEGGWGYMVALANVLIFIVSVSPLQTFGIIYGDFFESLGGRTSNMTLTLSIFHLFFSMTGLFTNILFKTFSSRQIGVTGAVLYTIANISIIFVASMAHIVIAYSAIGISLGLMMPALFTSFNQYFVKKRLQIFLATKPFISIGTTCYPILVHGLRELYGFNGMLAVLSAIHMHGILATVMLQPTKRHLKQEVIIKKPVSEEVLELMPKTQKSNNLELENFVKMETKEPLLNGEVEENSINNDELKAFSEEDTKMKNLKPQTKLISERKTDSSLWLKIRNLFDLTLLKDYRYVNMVIGIIFAEFSCQTFMPLLPIYLEKSGWSKADISFCLSGVGLADFVSTAVLALSAPYYRAKSRHLYLAGVLITIVARTVFIFLRSYTSIFIVLCVIWFFRMWMLASGPMVFAEYFTPQRFPAAYGMYNFALGINSVVMNLVAGYIRDTTGSYYICFYFLIFCLLVCGIPWTIEILWTKLKKSSIPQENR